MAQEETQNEFNLKFGGEPNSIDASTLGYSLVNITSIIQEISAEIQPGTPIEIKVKAHGEGSFLVYLALHASELGNLITFDNLKLAGAGLGVIITTLTGVFKIRKLLKGDPPKEVVNQENDSVTIKARDGNIIVVDKRVYNSYFGNPKISDALSKTFKTLDADPSVTGFEILKDKEPLFEADKRDFSSMALKGDLPLPEARSIVQNSHVHVVKPSFERGLKWDVVISGIRTPVAMKDEAFLTQVDAGRERFGKGDVLDVQLQIDQIYDPNVGAYLNKSYQINKVNTHIPRLEQPNLDGL